jgi:hypothetical protein
MYKILLFARDPGGANTIAPLVSPLMAKGYTVALFGKDFALAKFKKEQLQATDVMTRLKSITPDSVLHFLKEENPDVVVTGTSADDLAEKYLWKASAELKKPSIAILDQWINYRARFSRSGVAGLKDGERLELDFLPDKILVIDELSKKEAIAEGLPASRLVVTGQPYFEAIRKKKCSPEGLATLRKQLEINREDFVITFASEPITQTYNPEKNGSYWGYTEQTIFESLFNALAQLVGRIGRPIKLTVRLHPKEDISTWRSFLTKFKKNRVVITLNQTSDAQELIAISNLVCGMSSMFLLESYLLEKPTLSIQIGLQRDNPFILDRVGIIKSVLNLNDMERTITAVANGQSLNKSTYKLISNPIERIVKYIERLLCQN